MSKPRLKPDPAQLPVIGALNGFVNRAGTLKAAANKLGVAQATVRSWAAGHYPIPDWVCEVLGFRKQYVRCGPVGIEPAYNASLDEALREAEKHLAEVSA